MLKLKYVRLKGGQTQKEIESQLGLTHAIYSAIENGRMTRPYYSTIMKLQDIFKIPIEMLLAEALPEEIELAIQLEKILKSKSGKKGGTVTSVLYGRKYMKDIGRRGAVASAIKAGKKVRRYSRRKIKKNSRVRV